MNSKKITILMPIFFIVLSLVLGGYCLCIPEGEGSFLFIVSIIMLLSSSGLLFFTLKSSAVSVDFSDCDIQKVLITIGALILYTLLLSVIGFLLDTALLGSFIIWYLKHGPWKKPIIVGIIATIAVYFVFNVLLAIPLPSPFFLQ